MELSESSEESEIDNTCYWNIIKIANIVPELFLYFERYSISK